jgi:hypothetical protein
VTSLRSRLAQDARIAYALTFGSTARGIANPHSDLDIAIGLVLGVSLAPAELGTLVSDLEHAQGRRVDLVLLDEAPPPLAYRIFRDGRTLFERDHGALADRKARAILDYLDFRPTEDVLTRGALAAAARGR